jgi:YYY domain-containing protein
VNIVFDWLSREGGIVLSWWALVTAAGIAALPLSFRLLRWLPDHGYTLARAVGLLLTGFVFWLLASFGFLRNTPGSILLAWVIVLAAGLIVYLRAPIDLRAWWRENNRVVIVGEILFFVMLFAWAIYRAHQNSITATEKPMELAFLSSVMRSPTFPPADPWLSGYAISYYYFGYVIAAMLSVMSGISSTVGFNMTAALLFALTGLGAFGVVYNLVRSRSLSDGLPKRDAALWSGLIGTIFVALLGNFQMPLIEIPYQTNTSSQEYLAFWDSDQRQNQLGGAGSANLDEWGGWWWFRSARVLNDRHFNGQREEVIDEFPAFSFVLSDNHPHVLSLPFAVMALGLALNVALMARKPDAGETAFYGVVIGGLIFLNTWDGPIYAAALVGADAVRRLLRGRGLTGADMRGLIGFGIALLVVAVIAYLPFIVAFRSQAAGIIPNIEFPTLFRQFFVMFAPLLLILVPFLALEVWRGRGRLNWRFAARTGLLVLGVLIALTILLAVMAYLIPATRTQISDFITQNGGAGRVIELALSKRLTHSLTAILLTLGVIVVLARLFPRQRADAPADSESPIYPPATGFALLLIGMGLILTLAPEFVYLRDNFGARMNTVFKFYYQAWLAWGIAAAYAVYSILSDHRLPRPSLPLRAAFVGVLAVVFALGLMFPTAAVYHRAIVEPRLYLGENAQVTLDGGGTFTWADDYQVAMCLGQLVEGSDVTVAQAVGGQYHGEFGTVATLTGLPVVLNWVGHQMQWRGVEGYFAVAGTREADLQTLYETRTWRDASIIINRYGIDYVVFGTMERATYQADSELKFLDNLEVVCESGGSRIYRVTPEAVQFSE